eukprot:1981289-Rhodomonas_salina.1
MGHSQYARTGSQSSAIHVVQQAQRTAGCPQPRTHLVTGNAPDGVACTNLSAPGTRPLLTPHLDPGQHHTSA